MRFVFHVNLCTPEGFLREGMDELLGNYYSIKIAQDTMRSMKNNATNGYFNGGRVPYGYQVVPDGDNPMFRGILMPIFVNSNNTTKTGEKDSNQELKQLLQQLLVALEKNTQQSSQDSQKVRVAVEELENTVGRPIRRAIEENKPRVRN